MTGAGQPIYNHAAAGATVGIQAETVHNAHVYQVLPDAPPEKRYEVGVRYLNDGLPSKALERIGEAIAQGLDSPEVRFHWLLAMLGKRTIDQLSAEERGQLRYVRCQIPEDATDVWARGIHAIYGLLDCHEQHDRDPGPALKELYALDPQYREQIVRHLDLMLTGSIRDKTWADTMAEVEVARTRGDRSNRVWAYFYPDPARDRTQLPMPQATRGTDWTVAVAMTALLVASYGYLGWLVLVRWDVLPVLAFLATAAGGGLLFWYGLDWRYRVERLRVKEMEFCGVPRIRRPPADGFASRVDRLFDHYFWKYVPYGTDRNLWLRSTAGIRSTMRDEVVELYRETRVTDKKIAWLVRYLVSDVKHQWRAGTLFGVRQRYGVTIGTKLWCFLGGGLLVVGAVAVVISVIPGQVLIAVPLVGVALAAGRSGVRRWLRIIIERRRYAEEYRECCARQANRHEAYLAWKARLDAIRPSEEELEGWLEADRKTLLRKAIQHYKLAWREIIAYAMVQTPPQPADDKDGPVPYSRGRQQGGPWRYSRYELRLFLLTADGVREMACDLDFERAQFSRERRSSFRYDAVASVRVSKTRTSEQTLHLTLINGPALRIRIAEPASVEFGGEDSQQLAEMTLDSAGFEHALHILEGIAAEGKHWIRTRPDRVGLGRSDSSHADDFGAGGS